MSDESDSHDGLPASRSRRFFGGIRAYILRKRAKIILRTLVFSFILAVCWPYITVVVPAGQVGVVFSPLFGGTMVGRPLQEGLRLVLPWNDVILYNTRVQVRQSQFEAVTREGLHVRLGVIYRYRIHATAAGRLHKIIGPQFAHVLLDPAINSVVRKESSFYSSDEVYGPKRSELQNRIYSGVVDPKNRNLIDEGSNQDDSDMFFGFLKRSRSIARHPSYVPLIELVDVVITEVRLPDRVRDAIEKKEEQQQVQQEYVFRIEREKLESERKRVEAEGIRDFQQIVQTGISENYLRWRGIEATLRLATSPNSKTVIVGGGRTGMPLILNADGAEGGSAPSPQRSKRSAARPASSAAANDSMDLTSTTDQGSLEEAESDRKSKSNK